MAILFKVIFVFSGIDTDEIESHIENFEEEVIEFLVSVQETVVEEWSAERKAIWVVAH